MTFAWLAEEDRAARARLVAATPDADRGAVAAIAAALGLGCARAALDGALWRPATDGEAGVAVTTAAVWPPPLRTAFADALADRFRDSLPPPPPPVDLVAWRARDPGRWRLRTGLGVWLGESAVAAARGFAFDAEERADAGMLRLAATPEAWMDACAGACWSGRGAEPAACLVAALEADGPGLRDLLWGVGRVVCDDAAHAEVVFKALRRRRKETIPDVFVSQEPGARIQEPGARNLAP